QSLLLHHRCVSSSHLHQLFVSSSLQYPTTLHEANLVTVSDRIQSMGDGDGSSTLRRSIMI
ncbi:hypothetical protein PMAYCL1PPCAC_19144, partial [Pristionchus mayeri]